MREAYKSKFTFIGKSLAWSVFLYFAAIAILEWNDLSGKEKPIIVEVKYIPSRPIQIDASIQHGIKGTTYSASKLAYKFVDIIDNLFN